MINANELRIGNLVTDEFYESFKTIIEVEDLNIKGINLEICDDGNYPEIAKTWIAPSYTFDKLYGIPLTEEILLKCGFWRITKRESFYKKGSIWAIGVDDTLICLDPDWREQPSFHCGIEYTDSPNHMDENTQHNFAHNIKYLHQLQNLYFALTGEELKIEL